MEKIIIVSLIFFVIGLIFGYFIFAKVGNEYINVIDFFVKSKNDELFKSVGNSLRGLEIIKRNILLMGTATGSISSLITGIIVKE